jgi:hypothetical protein
VAGGFIGGTKNAAETHGTKAHFTHHGATFAQLPLFHSLIPFRVIFTIDGTQASAQAS